MNRRHANERLEHGRPLKSTVEIDVPAGEVWAVIAEPGSLAHYHPFRAATEVERWPGTGSRDSITCYSGIRYQRNFVSWHEGIGYDVELGDPPNQTAQGLRDRHPQPMHEESWSRIRSRAATRSSSRGFHRVASACRSSRVGVWPSGRSARTARVSSSDKPARFAVRRLVDLGVTNFNPRPLVADEESCEVLSRKIIPHFKPNG